MVRAHELERLPQPGRALLRALRPAQVGVVRRFEVPVLLRGGVVLQALPGLEHSLLDHLPRPQAIAGFVDQQRIRQERPEVRIGAFAELTGRDVERLAQRVEAIRHRRERRDSELFAEDVPVDQRVDQQFRAGGTLRPQDLDGAAQAMRVLHRRDQHGVGRAHVGLEQMQIVGRHARAGIVDGPPVRPLGRDQLAPVAVGLAERHAQAQPLCRRAEKIPVDAFLDRGQHRRGRLAATAATRTDPRA